MEVDIWRRWWREVKGKDKGLKVDNNTFLEFFFFKIV